MTNPGHLNIRALKIIVIGLGILIALALAMLAYGFYKKSVDPGWKPFGDPTIEKTNGAPGASSAPFDDVVLGLPAGCRVMDITAEGTLAYLRIGPDNTCEQVIVIDTDTGTIVGRIIPR